MDDNSMCWLGAHSTLTYHGRLDYLLIVAERFALLMSLETRDHAAQANKVIESFEMHLCEQFNQLAADLLEVPKVTFDNLDWPRTIKYIKDELLEDDREWDDE